MTTSGTLLLGKEQLKVSLSNQKKCLSQLTIKCAINEKNNWGFRCTLTRLSPSSEGTICLPEMAMPLMDAEQMKTSTCHLTDCCKPTELEKRCFSVLDFRRET